MRILSSFLVVFRRVSELFRFDDDSASEQEVIDGIVGGVDFRGAKLWVLVIAVFVASLGLNINSAAVIIGAMLISPIMGPIIGMGLAVGIYDFDLLRRSWRNYIIATLFSILTATVYFLITPLAEAQSELLARTSPTIYDVLIALCGGLAGIIALSSRSQRSGNVIPGVAIATALMPPLCTVGFGIATANWSYALGAFYLFLINTIFIAFATVIGATLIMGFQKKAFIDQANAKRVKRIIVSIVVVTMFPAVLLTVGMVRENYFEQRVSMFVRHEMHFPMTHVISQHADYDKRSFSVVLIGNEVDSLAISTARDRLHLYNLDGVQMQIIQGAQNVSRDDVRRMLVSDNKELSHAEAIIANQQKTITELEQQLQLYTQTTSAAPQMLGELRVLFPQIVRLTIGRGTEAAGESSVSKVIAILVVDGTMPPADADRIKAWIGKRIAEPDVKVIVEQLPQGPTADR